MEIHSKGTEDGEQLVIELLITNHLADKKTMKNNEK